MNHERLHGILVQCFLFMAVAVGILVVLECLLIVAARETVKRDLNKRILRPLNIRWCPLAKGWFYGALALIGNRAVFRVRYVDFADQEHEAFCKVDWDFGGINWLNGELKDHNRETSNG